MPIIDVTLNTIATDPKAFRVCTKVYGKFADIMILNNTATGIIYMTDHSNPTQGEGIPLAATTGEYENDQQNEELYLHAAVYGTIVKIKVQYIPQMEAD